MNSDRSRYDSNLQIILGFARRLDLGGRNEQVCRLIVERRLREARLLCEQVLREDSASSDDPAVSTLSTHDIQRRNLLRLEHMLKDLE